MTLVYAKKKALHPRKKSIKSTPAKQKKSKPQKKSTKKHFGAFKSTQQQSLMFNVIHPNTQVGTWILTPVTPFSAKRAVVRALMDWAENVCSDPDILAKEMEHLNRVLCYTNYPQWMIDKQGKSDKHNPIIYPETGVEIQKHFYISVPYFPGLSESYKKIFKYTPIQVCFKGVNTLKSANASQRQKSPPTKKRT